MERPIIALNNVWVEFGSIIVLEDITLAVCPREIVSIVGPNGSGKTTLLRTMMGLTRPTRGTVSILETAPAEIMRTGRIGYLPQERRQDERFPVTAYDVVAMSRFARTAVIERLTRTDRQAIEGALETVGMADAARAHFGSLSGGQKQRVLIARALALNPEILLLDEPSTGLDAVAQDSFYLLLRKLRDERGLAIVIVSHDIGTVSMIVDTVACIKRKLHFHGKPADCLGSDRLAEVFGKNVYVLHHDKNCPTCRDDHA
ncbi:MAG TPA: metal ABC transporter ATP-binding protein [Spirochaetota bacterium]|nr:metal ABC transporter ATP-binding protein [Spirochaetota bacterium]HNT10453.1 metal ABC transporter ATP-binding protein [Spirochaetota bacterium]